MRQPKELIYAVRLGVVAKYVGELAVALSGLITIPALVALFTGGVGLGLRLLGTAVALATLAFLLARRKEPSQIQRNEALVVVALSFVVAPLCMVFPLTAAGISPIDALFEAVSGVTTTGLTALGTVEDKSPAFLFARSWMQWFGGLGFVVVSAVLLTRPGGAARSLGAVKFDDQDLVGGTRAHARRVLQVYLTLTVVGVVLLVILGLGPYHSVLHTLAAVSTGGFSPYDESLSALRGWLARAGVCALFLVGALPLAVYHRAFPKGWRELLSDPQIRTLVFCGIALAALLVVMTWLDRATFSGQSVGRALLTAFSAQTTAGFSVTSPAELNAGAKLLLVASMIIGGSAGSTAGGLKIFRLLVIMRLVQVTFLRTAIPRHAILEPRLGGNRLTEQELQDAFVLAFLFLAVIGASWLAFALYGYSPLDALFEVASAVGTVGLSTGIAGPDLPSVLKLVLCTDMLMGRLEVFAFLVLLYPRTWVGGRRETS